MLNRTFIFTNVIIAAAIGLAVFFPTENAFQEVFVLGAFFLVLPFGFIRWVLREPLEHYGVRRGAGFTDWLWVLGSLAAFGAAALVLLRFAELEETLDISVKLHASFVFFLLYLGVLLTFQFFLECFFRGLVLFGWAKALGAWAILIQAVLFGLFLMLSEANFILAADDWLDIGGALLAGTVAYRTRSLFLSFSFSALSVILLLVMIIFFSQNV